MASKFLTKNFGVYCKALSVEGELDLLLIVG